MLKLILAVLALGVALATPARALPAATHDYEFAGTLADSDGSSALVAIAGGTLGTAAAPGFAFGTDQGLQLAGAVSASGPWSIEVLFDYNAIGRYEKIIDFSGLKSDSGLYTTYNALSLYPAAVASVAQLTPGTLADLVLTRSAAGLVTAYVNGVQSFTDDDSLAGLTALGSNPLTFFADDAATGGREDQPGFVRLIRTYDTVLTPTDAAALATGAAPPGTTAVPEPATPALLAGLLLAGALTRLLAPRPAPGRHSTRTTGPGVRTRGAGVRTPLTSSTSA